jgi:hypothetical protein
MFYAVSGYHARERSELPARRGNSRRRADPWQARLKGPGWGANRRAAGQLRCPKKCSSEVVSRLPARRPTHHCVLGARTGDPGIPGFQHAGRIDPVQPEMQVVVGRHLRVVAWHRAVEGMAVQVRPVGVCC